MLSTEQRTQTLDGRGSFSTRDFADVQARCTSLQYVATYLSSGTIATEGGEPERLLGAAVSADYFSVLGVQPILGRVFTREEDKPGAAPVLVISYSLWQRRYGGDPSIIGREVNLGGKTTVIGVLPKEFKFPISQEVQEYWEPLFLSTLHNKGSK
jgi:hypothetical protein